MGLRGSALLRAVLQRSAAPAAAGSGYWCSAGSHEAGEVVSWSGRIPAARSIKGIEVGWVHAPKEVRVLTSPDGSNFEEALCWKATGKDGESFTETLLFSRALPSSPPRDGGVVPGR